VSTTYRFQVEGMDCPSCVGKVETALKRLAGVSDVSASFATETVALKIDATAPTRSGDIISSLRALGFGAALVGSGTATTRPAERSAEPAHDHCGCGHDHGHGHEENEHVHGHGHDHGHAHDDDHDHHGHGHVHDHAHHHAHHHALAHPGHGDGCAHDGIAATAAPAARAKTLSASHWWQTRKGRLVLILGALLGAAQSAVLLGLPYAQWALVAAVIAGVVPFARQAVALARGGSPFSIQMLMSIAAIGALAIGDAMEAGAVVFLFAVGELLESVAAGRARAGIKALAALAPKTALRLNADGTTREVGVEDLVPGDLVLVRPGDRVSADGIIVEGQSALDESPVTGESMPAFKQAGDSVFAGSINADHALRVRVEKTSADNTIARIIHLVEEAQSNKAPIARFIERFSAYYTPAVMLIAAVVIVAPPLLLQADWQTWIYRGLTLLLIACPCALVLSTPAAIASALAAATRRGLLIKGGHALETIGRSHVMAFDKTGTLTEGRPQVTDILASEGETAETVLARAAAVESGSSHPLALAITGEARKRGLAVPAAQGEKSIAGKAVSALVEDRHLAVGSPAYAASKAPLSPALLARCGALEAAGKTVVVLIDETHGAPLGLLALRDEPRPDARAAIGRLKELGVHPIMLTGDNRRTAQAIAGGVAIDWQAELLPEDKLRAVENLRRNGKVAMVGDGINDAPALASADVGIAMGGGTDVALETADAALIHSRVSDLAQLVELSRATMANIRQNVTIALGLKGVFLVTTIAGITGLWPAVLADTGATAIVTLNALRLLAHKPARIV
jgi:Cd2+/Zn2+-exporting ATPase